MEIFIGLDVSLASTSACALGANGRIVDEAKVPSDPGSLAAPPCRRCRDSIVGFGLRGRSSTGILCLTVGPHYGRQLA